MTALDIRVREKAFPAADGGPPLLLYRDFEASFASGTFVCLLGPSGIGKTTLLNMVAGLDRDFDGSITFGEGREPRLSYAFQTPRLLPWRTVLENTLLVMPPGPESRAAALGLLDEVGLKDVADAYPERLSLGMQRRVALARAFAVEPELLLMDEPFVSLDEAAADRLRDLLRRLLKARRATVIFVTHDTREAVRLADRIMLLDGPPPARVLRDVEVELDARQRGDAAAVRAFRAGALAVGAPS